MGIEIVTAVAAAASAFFAAYQLYRNRKENAQTLDRERKQATIEAYNVLQEQALDFLNTKYKKKKLEEIAQNHLNDEYREEYRIIGTKLARCEHFAVGVEEKAYDFETLYKLSGKHLWYLYQTFSPVIQEKQKTEKAAYSSFQKLAHGIKEHADREKND